MHVAEMHFRTAFRRCQHLCLVCLGLRTAATKLAEGDLKSSLLVQTALRYRLDWLFKLPIDWAAVEPGILSSPVKAVATVYTSLCWFAQPAEL